MVTAHRILLVDDHSVLRDGLRALLSFETDLEVAGEAADGAEAIRRAAQLKPDLVLLDLVMPLTNGIEALAEIKRVSPGTRVLVLSAHKTQEHVVGALGAGADGYLLKDESGRELVAACRAVLAGEGYISGPIASMAAKVVREEGVQGVRPSRGPDFGKLSGRELEVLKLVAEGRRTREISASLFISPRTVERHRANLMKKLNLHSVSALTTYGIDHGLVNR